MQLPAGPAWIDLPGLWMRGHLTEISISITAMVLVVSGPYLNAGAKKMSGSLHWLARYALFVLLSTLGYGLLSNICMRNIRGFLLGLGHWQMSAAVISIHLALAWLLKRERAI